jgi:hypothetical protein
MNRAAHFLSKKRTLALALLSAFASLAPSVQAQTTTPPTTPMHMIGTVRAVDTKTRMIEVITGVGLAVRIMRFQAAEDCRITVPWAAEHLSSFISGTHARIEYVAAPAGAGASVQGIVVAIEALDVDRPEGSK